MKTRTTGIARLRRISVAALTATALFAGGCSSNAATAKKPAQMVAQSFTTGKQVSLADYTGKPLLVTSFASWCAECVGELPKLESYYRSNPSPEILAIDLDGASGKRGAQALITKNSLSMPIWLDANKHFLSVFSAPGTPTTVLLNSDHTIAHRWFGPVDFTSSSFRSAVAQVAGA